MYLDNERLLMIIISYLGGMLAGIILMIMLFFNKLKMRESVISNDKKRRL